MIVKRLGPVAWDLSFDAMRAFTAARDAVTPDELWLCEHPPVFTQGIAGRAAHLRDPGDIPVVASDRGGQVTYHGPGQVVAYPLVDLRRLGIYVKEYVFRLEQALLKALDETAAGARSALQKTTDEHLLTKWRLLAKGQVVLEAPRYVMIQDTINHWAHHRGQMTVYLRLMGAKVPALYGPSADDTRFL